MMLLSLTSIINSTITLIGELTINVRGVNIIYYVPRVSKNYPIDIKGEQNELRG